MKYILFFIIIFISCNVGMESPVPTQVSSVDSILKESMLHMDTAKIVSDKSDSAVKKDVIKVIREFKILNNEIEKYKIRSLNTQQVVATERIIYKTDTVYIETKKNFWGKERTKTSIKSDSSVNESTDSTIKIDTTDH
jgi:hypothetical protein